MCHYVSIYTKAAYPDIFENACFLSVLGSRPHVAGVFPHQKRIFWKTLSKVDFFENSVFYLSCGRAKRIFLKTLTSQPGSYSFKANNINMVDNCVILILSLLSGLVACL